MFKWSVQEGRSGGRQILHVRVSKGFASRPFYLGLGISKIVIFTFNFFRIEDTDGFTADDYRNQLNTLKREYSRSFPKWAVTQSAKIENGK